MKRLTPHEIENFRSHTAEGIRAQEWEKADEEYNLFALNQICDRAIAERVVIGECEECGQTVMTPLKKFP